MMTNEVVRKTRIGLIYKVVEMFLIANFILQKNVDGSKTGPMAVEQAVSGRFM